MRLGLCVVALVLSWMHLAAGSRGIKGKRQRRISAEGSQACAKGCELCSEVNGCLKCSPKLFILLERNDIRQVGVCLPSCPPGYFDARNPDMNKCIKCKIEHCEACFSHNFCTKCKESLYLHKGRCYPACPEGSAAANGTMECSSPAQCEMSEWSLWGPCSKKKRLCGFRRGSEERTRRVLHAPGGDHAVCSDTKETRKCTGRRGGKGARAAVRAPTGTPAGRRARRRAPAPGDARASTSLSTRGQRGQSRPRGPPRDVRTCRPRGRSPALLCVMEALRNWSAGGEACTHSPYVYGHTDTHTHRTHVPTCSQHTSARAQTHRHTIQATEDASISRTSPCEQGGEVEGSPSPGRGPSGMSLGCDAPKGHTREPVSQCPSPNRVEASGGADRIGPAWLQEPKLEDCSAFPAV